MQVRPVECLWQRLKIYWPPGRLTYRIVDAGPKCTYPGLSCVETRKSVFLDVIFAIMNFS
jgi:hypothetical protein